MFLYRTIQVTVPLASFEEQKKPRKKIMHVNWMISFMEFRKLQSFVENRSHIFGLRQKLSRHSFRKALSNSVNAQNLSD